MNIEEKLVHAVFAEGFEEALDLEYGLLDFCTGLFDGPQTLQVLRAQAEVIAPAAYSLITLYVQSLPGLTKAAKLKVAQKIRNLGSMARAAERPWKEGQRALVGYPVSGSPSC